MRGINSCGTMRVGWIILIVTLVLLYIVILQNYEGSHIVQQQTGKVKTLRDVTPSSINEWETIFQEKKISSIRKLDQTEMTGLCQKYEVIFETGHKAIGRRLRNRNNFIKYGWETLSINDAGIDELLFPRRANREYQGWAHYSSHIIAKVLQLDHHMIPVVMKDITNINIINETGTFVTRIGRIFSSLYSILYMWDNEYLQFNKEWMVIEPYLENFQYTPPHHSYFNYLSLKKAFLDPRYHISPKLAAQISDTLLFDFLVEDNDRYENHNWISDQAGNLLIWDSGLAFAHGPIGQSSILDLLCGPREWRDHANNLLLNLGRKTCLRICKFRNSTLTHLSNYYHDIIHNSLRNDIMDAFSHLPYNVLRENLYYGYVHRLPKYQFQVTDFYAGIEQKLVKFFSHVDECVAEFGVSYVYDSELDLPSSLNSSSSSP